MKAEEGIELVDRDQLRRYFEQGCKSSSEWGIGSEYENFIFDMDLKRPISYEGPKSISKIFELDRYLRGAVTANYTLCQENGASREAVYRMKGDK